MDGKKVIYLADGGNSEQPSHVSNNAEPAPQFTNTVNTPTDTPAQAQAQGGGFFSSPFSSNKAGEEPVNNADAVSEDGDMGSEGEASEGGDMSDAESDFSDMSGGAKSSSSGASINTAEILTVDPMYVRMEKFLTTERAMEGGGGVRKVNIADILYDLSDTLKDLKLELVKANKFKEQTMHR